MGLSLLALFLSCCEAAQRNAGRNGAAWSKVRRCMAGILAEGTSQAGRIYSSQRFGSHSTNAIQRHRSESTNRSTSMSTGISNERVAHEVSRRRFLISSGVAVAAAYLVPSRLFAQQGLVEIALKASATAKISVQALRRNISVLLGPGGNIAVLTGSDGKLLIDAEVVTARPNVAAALASINGDPVKQLINTHWHFDHTGGNE